MEIAFGSVGDVEKESERDQDQTVSEPKRRFDSHHRLPQGLGRHINYRGDYRWVYSLVCFRAWPADYAAKQREPSRGRS